MLSARVRVATIALLILTVGAAWGHKPIFSSGIARDREHAILIKAPDVSQVCYHEITPECPVLWLAFDLEKGQQVYLQTGVPVLDRLKGYRPSMALIGPGLPEIAPPFEIPEATGGIVWGTHSVTEPRFFHEPFTGTDSWVLKEARTQAPETGRYYAVAFVPSGAVGKLWLAIGEREQFGPEDMASFADWLVKVRRFHEVPEPGG